MCKIRRRTIVAGAFSDGKSALMLVGAGIRHVAGTKCGGWRYMNMDRLKELQLKIAMQYKTLRAIWPLGSLRVPDHWIDGFLKTKAR